jgi:hypothetical protein
MSEDILYHIMTVLQSQSTASSDSEHHLNILKASNFWNIILRATGSVAKLNSNPFVKNTKTFINELAGLLIEKTIDVHLLQQILEYNDKYLFRHFDAKKKALGDVIVSRDEIAILRKICNHYQIHLDILSKFYSGFCPIGKVTDVVNFIRDVKEHLQNLDKIMCSYQIIGNSMKKLWTVQEIATNSIDLKLSEISSILIFRKMLLQPKWNT